MTGYRYTGEEETGRRECLNGEEGGIDLRLIIYFWLLF